MLTLAYLRRSFRETFQRKFPRHKLADDGTRVRDGQPVMTPRLGRTEAIALLGDWEDRGLVEDAAAFKKALVVQRNADDPDRLDFLVPPDLINQLRIVGATFPVQTLGGAMSNRRAGIISFKIDGTAYDARGNFEYNLGIEKRTSIIGSDGVHGYSAAPQAAFIRGEITDRGDLSVKQICELDGPNITLDLANGKSILIREAFFTGDGTVGSEQAAVPVEFPEPARGRGDHMSKRSITLTRPIEAHGETVDMLELREPTIGMLKGVRVELITDEETGAVSSRMDLGDIPRSSRARRGSRSRLPRRSRCPTSSG